MVDLWWQGASQRPAVGGEQLLASPGRKAVSGMGGVFLAAPPPLLQRVQVLQAARELRGISLGLQRSTLALRQPPTSGMDRG